MKSGGIEPPAHEAAATLGLLVSSLQDPDSPQACTPGRCTRGPVGPGGRRIRLPGAGTFMKVCPQAPVGTLVPATA